MALSKVNFNSMNVTPAASKAIKFNSSNNGLETGDIGGSLVLISTQTASSSANISFTSGIDSTYKEYIFKFVNIHPQTTEDFMFQCNAAGGSGYNETITSTTFETYNAESGGTPGVGYDAGRDQAQGTSFQPLANNIQNDSDSGGAGFLRLFDPSSTTFVKHFMGTMTYMNGTQSQTIYSAGYINTTSAIDEVQFKMESGNIDAGTIKMYGVL